VRATTALALVFVVLLGACRESALRVTAEDGSAKPSATPAMVPSAAPGEELGVYLEAIGYDSTSRHFYWPTTAWQPCRTLARATNPPQIGFVEMTLALGEDGKVTKVEVLGGEGLEPPVVTCITDAARATKFPDPEWGKASVYGYVTLR
jgi:hypothetical protein